MLEVWVRKSDDVSYVEVCGGCQIVDCETHRRAGTIYQRTGTRVRDGKDGMGGRGEKEKKRKSKKRKEKKREGKGMGESNISYPYNCLYMHKTSMY